MIIGSLDIHKKNNIFDIVSINTNISINTSSSHDSSSHDSFSILLESFQLNHHSYLFTANTIVSLDDFIKNNCFTIELATLFIKSIYNQTQFLSERNLGISFIDISDIMVINNHSFYFCNSNKLFNIHANKIKINEVYDKNNCFLPPEFIQNDTLPFSTLYSSFFYSLGILTLYCLLKTNKQFSSYDDVLNHYKYSKIHFTISQCLLDNPIQRNFFLF